MIYAIDSLNIVALITILTDVRIVIYIIRNFTFLKSFIYTRAHIFIGGEGGSCQTFEIRRKISLDKIDSKGFYLRIS